MKVRYTQPALATRNHLIDEREDPTSGARLYQRFAAATALLAHFPNRGRSRVGGSRKLLITGTPYR